MSQLFRLFRLFPSSPWCSLPGNAPSETDLRAPDLCAVAFTTFGVGLAGSGGFVSALLSWAMEDGYIDCALTSFLECDGTSWKAIPGIATNKDEILAILDNTSRNLARLFTFGQRGEHLLVLQNGLVEFAAWFRICREAVPDYLVVKQIATLNIRVRSQHFIGDFFQLGVSPISPR